jgi:hypothetical protein
MISDKGGENRNEEISRRAMFIGSDIKFFFEYRENSLNHKTLSYRKLERSLRVKESM